MTVLNLQVAAGADDAYEVANNSGFNGTDTRVFCDSASSIGSRTDGGFRFAGVTIPQGSTISAAVLTVEPIDTSHDDANVVIKAEAVDNAVGFVTNADVVSRARTTASVSWVQNSVAVGGQSPDISAVIQEIIARAGWASGNALVVFMDGKSDTEKFFRPASYEHTTKNPVKLDITYTSNNFVAIVGGALTPQGVHLGLLAKSFAGAMTPGGVLATLLPSAVSLAGALTPEGALTVIRSLASALSGALTPAGTHMGALLKNFAGVVSMGGTVSSIGLHNFAGALTPSGAISMLRNVLLAGVITPAGLVLQNILTSFSGEVAPTGLLGFLQAPLKIVGRLRAYVTERDGTPRGHLLP